MTSDKFSHATRTGGNTALLPALPNYLVKFFLSLACLLAIGCESVYYNAWEKLGVEKRDILVDRVEDARDSQEDAQEQFSSALEQFSALVNFDGGDLEKVYNRLDDEYQDSVAAADKVSSRIADIESVAKALFSEWQDEIAQYTNTRFRADSQTQLNNTKARYAELERSLRTAERSMAPVLATMKDNVLYLKHNLNARAIGALRGEYLTIKRDIDNLLIEMNAAITRSNQFIATLEK
ncbi:MAG: DUF2959 domain-containing protein [Gammaproteobacteria bacterium]|nr:DUF2959 domain-containing protein [Gammaproteobacteria bacterium]MBT8150426.1 DUF2959 domain-containing protein [Gammaproteobacteria bacterium]NND39439.1 DUF2959 domain-containing protein [Pseudomonadales bacterium]NNM11772.1 DUF2959 domain-containing protein [Pseudomonadales bacterium]RZV56338.1 MAG: DUF2959 domain-containing protein [Pseudomonadales bacterium]